MTNKYLIHVSWNIELSPALQLLSAAEPKAHRTFVVSSSEQPSLVVLQKIARLNFKDEYNSKGFAVSAITKLEHKLTERTDLFEIDNNNLDVE